MTIIFRPKSREDEKLIRKIAERAIEDRDKTDLNGVSRIEMEMCISACHLNGTPLRLKELLEAPDADFVHDVSGIYEHMDRSVGKLTGGFKPRMIKNA